MSSLLFGKKSAKHVLLFISKGILDQFSIAQHFIVLAHEFERVFGKANSEVLYNLFCIIRMNMCNEFKIIVDEIFVKAL